LSLWAGALGRRAGDSAAIIFDRNRHCERTKAIQARKKRQIVLIALHKRGDRARYFVTAFAMARQI
jgi:hypothetical protein